MKNFTLGVIAIGVVVAASSSLHAAVAEAGYTYSWNADYSGSGSQGDLAATEWDANNANNSLLSDGAVAANGDFGWPGGELGAIIQNTNPSLTIDLGSVQDLNSLVFLYNVHYGFGVPDPAQVTITIDAGSPIVFSAFPNVAANSVSRVVPIDLTGNSGQMIQLDVVRGGEWLPFSEIDVLVNAVPAPAAMPAGLAMLGLIATRRRRK